MKPVRRPACLRPSPTSSTSSSTKASTLLILTRPRLTLFSTTGIFQPRQNITVKRYIKSDVFTVFTISTAVAVDPPHETQELKVADHIDSIARFWALLRNFPGLFLNPLGGTQDLYGRDASIMEVTTPEEMIDAIRDQWEIPPPSEEQKAQFDEVVSIIDKWCMHGCA
ncbi:hypothetical protein JVT61DRAFT_8155 [Boletus reticuloceps]|uniref:Uncharacterized protein n=1 Tax=Boletus reticuloceps TaxID=495285 RepID=A0A8I3AE58_9AGAM|nr:hypothetical protein JVT61DRAFT_8155 [Boletus reticuloceps]